MAGRRVLMWPYAYSLVFWDQWLFLHGDTFNSVAFCSNVKHHCFTPELAPDIKYGSEWHTMSYIRAETLKIPGFWIITSCFISACNNSSAIFSPFSNNMVWFNSSETFLIHEQFKEAAGGYRGHSIVSPSPLKCLCPQRVFQTRIKVANSNCKHAEQVSLWAKPTTLKKTFFFGGGA